MRKGNIARMQTDVPEEHAAEFDPLAEEQASSPAARGKALLRDGCSWFSPRLWGEVSPLGETDSERPTKDTGYPDITWREG